MLGKERQQKLCRRRCCYCNGSYYSGSHCVGLGTCWIGAFDPIAFKAFEIEGYGTNCLTPLGYQADFIRRKETLG